MPCLSDEEDIQLPSDPNYIILQTDRRKCGAERVSFSGEGSISVPSPVKEIKFEKQGRIQEQSTLCAAHVTAIGYHPALQYPFASGGVGYHSIPSPVKLLVIQAPQYKHIANYDEDEWEVIAEYATNNQQAIDAYEIVDDIYRHDENSSFMRESNTVMQPDYVGKQEDLYLWCLIGESKTCWQYAFPMCYSCRCDTCVRITETKQTLILK
jgi:hypothetical protein